jgi:hypothetical protein
LNLLKPIHSAWLQLKQVRLLPQRVAQALKEREARVMRDDDEAERLDRIRNPSKYRGK